MKQGIVIAIDGPSASGKSTVARRVAKALGFSYVDSGALYRAVTWKALESGISASDAAAVVGLFERMDVRFAVRDGAVMFTVDGAEPGAALREARVNENVSPVAAIPEVRRQVVAWLREMARFGPLVVEGRDIGTVVFPATPHKFYLNASPEERARRRHAETTGSARVSVEEVGQSIARRDRTDSTRKADPLRVADGATIIDSTGMTVEEVADIITTAVRRAV